MKIQFIDRDWPIKYPVGGYINDTISFIDAVVNQIDNDDSFPTQNLAIWCRGSSGAILAALLSQYFFTEGFKEVRINHVKKPNEHSHSNNYLHVGACNIIIDDFIASGETVREIMKCMNQNGVHYVDYLIISDTSVRFDTDDNIVGLTYPVPRHLVVSKTNYLNTHSEKIESFEPEDLHTYSKWETEGE